MSRGRIQYGFGVFCGSLLLSWGFFLLSFCRKARFFHPSGVVYSAMAWPASSLSSVASVEVAERLSGAALVRFSGGLFKQKGKRVKRDSLGLGVRFYGQPGPCQTNARGGQDLFLVSFHSFAAIARDIKATDCGDYLANTYWSITPYEVEGLGRVSLRITASGSGEGTARNERLEDAVRAGEVSLRLEMAPWGTDDYQPLAELRLDRRMDLEDELRLTPRASGGGLRPTGFLQGLRVAPYAASHLARRLRRETPRRASTPDTWISIPDLSANRRRDVNASADLSSGGKRQEKVLA
ncbi:hypothetical protein [Archangium lansingense]|uniref:Uncharacterized protein n=1 Tax=Archangium lansingense TaxID=2995310 RepID=A0ABT4AGZ3_9BACT|nr:hypothetical protein [Archangium lansinium]MCY1080169.1 hypothetical protein [Archangium lansinium]